jgi:hypothetical protein
MEELLGFREKFWPLLEDRREEGLWEVLREEALKKWLGPELDGYSSFAMVVLEFILFLASMALGFTIVPCLGAGAITWIVILVVSLWEMMVFWQFDFYQFFFIKRVNFSVYPPGT